MRKLLGLGVVSLTATMLLTLSAGPALANHVHCGEVITQDTKLDSDLIDCPGDGIVIGADNITLDLNGHSIDGDGGASQVGLVELNHNGVTVENGTVSNFAGGVEIGGELDGPTGVGNVVRNLALSGAGIGVDGGRGNLIEGNAISDSAYGIALSDSFGNLIRRNSVVNSSVYGILVGGGGHNGVVRNSVSDSDVAIVVGDTTSNRLSRNFAARNRVGIQATDSPYYTRIERNLAYANAQYGILVDCCQDVILGNVANANGVDGIYVGRGSYEYSPNAVIRNTADYNADLGIEALPEVTDGGGNRAFGNGNPLQCLNVFCKTNGPKK